MKKTSIRPPAVSEHESQTVHLEFFDPVATSVFIAGTFNDWQPRTIPMLALGEGRWAKKLVLPPGAYEYCLVVDGQWIPDPAAADFVPNPFGSWNSVLKVTVQNDLASGLSEAFSLSSRPRRRSQARASVPQRSRTEPVLAS